MRPFLAMVLGTATPIALAAILCAGAWLMDPHGGFGPSWMGFLAVSSVIGGLFGSGFGIMGAQCSDPRRAVRNGALSGMVIPGGIFLLLAFSNSFGMMAAALPALAVLLIPGALAGGVAALILTKGTHGTA